MKKKVLSIILTIAVVLGNIPLLSAITTVASATDNNLQQIEYTGGWNPSDYETNGTLYKDRIAVSKTIAPTEDENYFDITLKVVAKQRVIDQSVDVVLVMDNSNTMNATHQNLSPGESGYNVKDARLTHAKNAISLFVDKYAADQNISQDRRFGLVTFNSYANTVIPLTTLNTTEQATTIKNTVNNIKAPTENRVRFTNIEGGLQLAKNLLDESDSVYKYIIFVTDGFPTTYIESGRDSKTQIVGYDTYMSGSYDAGKINQDGYFADSIKKKVSTYGTSYSDIGADRADDVADTIKKSGINIFSIGIDVGVQSIPDYIKQTEKASYTVVDRRNETFVIGDTKESYQNWLSESIAGGTLINEAGETELIHRYAEGNSAEQLEQAFTNILNDIELIPAETMQQAYTIDPMSDYVEFMNFYDLDGKETDVIINTRYGTDVATFDAETEQIRWTLTNTQSFYIDENTGNYVLYITYKVRLKNEVDGFVPSNAFDTNETTTLYFKTVDLESGTPLYGDNNIDYPIPQIEGYLGHLEFTKQDSVTGQPLEGAEFTLQHYGNSCDVCHGDAVIEDVATSSNAEGKVVFSNIPSGHEYVLIETKAPEGYQPGSYHPVRVTYGKTYLNGEEVTAESNAVITNQTIKPVEVVLSAQKKLTGRTVEDGEFTFILEGKGQDNVQFHERETNDGTGAVTFKGITFDTVGTYDFKVYEEKGTDTSVLYDETVYNVQLSITLSEDETEYIVTTKVNGEDVENDATPLPFEFENTLRQPTQVTIKAKKLLDGGVPEGTFTFELANEQGEIIQTKHNNGSDVIFDPITYSKKGVYNYTIVEGHECEGHDQQTDDSHIFFDHSVYSVVVTVTAPEDSDSFVANVEYYLSGKRSKVEEAVFENQTRGPATLKLNALKTMDGNIPEDGEFTFELRREDGEVIESVTNDANGVIRFEELQFNRVGYEKLTINEVQGDNNNVIYDKLIYTIHVVTEAIHNNPNYYLEVVAVKPGEESDMIMNLTGVHVELNENDFILFENKSRYPATVGFAGTKTLDEGLPEDEQFEFQLSDDSGVIETVKNNAEGVFEFTALQFNSVGQYNYTISEVLGTDENIIYDTKVYDITVDVTVADDTDTYYATVTVNGTEKMEGAELVFENISFNNETVEETTAPTTESTEPTTESTEPTTESTEPTTESTEPTTESTEPTTESTEPTTESTEPTTETDPIIEVTVPPVDKNTDVTEETESKSVAEEEETTTNPITSPQTDDNANMILWLGLLLASGGVFAKVTFFNKRRKTK